MKHAYLIIAHQEFPVLETLIELLDYPGNDIYLHIDRKVEYQVRYSPHDAQLFVVPDEKRIDVRWGDCSQIWSELALYKEAYRHGGYDYFHLLSGIDLPIKSQTFIHAFFEQHRGKVFLGLMQNAWRTRTKIAYYHFFTRHLRGKRLSEKIEQYLHWILTQAQKVFRVERSMKEFPEIVKGANWCSLPQDAVAYLLDREDWIRKRFKHTYAADEVYKAIILYNSPFQSRFYNTEDEYEGCLRLLDWQRGNPYIWRLEDLDLILDSNKLFARKFGTVDMDLVNRLKSILHE